MNDDVKIAAIEAIVGAGDHYDAEVKLRAIIRVLAGNPPILPAKQEIPSSPAASTEAEIRDAIDHR